MTKPKKPASRSAPAVAARSRTSAGPMKHRLEPRGGSRTTIDTDEDFYLVDDKDANALMDMSYDQAIATPFDLREKYWMTPVQWALATVKHVIDNAKADGPGRQSQIKHLCMLAGLVALRARLEVERAKEMESL